MINDQMIRSALIVIRCHSHTHKIKNKVGPHEQGWYLTSKGGSTQTRVVTHEQGRNKGAPPSNRETKGPPF